MMGTNISLLEYKAQGTPFSFGRTISVGFSNWWKGFKINFVTGLFATLVVVIVLAVILPGAFLIEEENAPIIGGVLLTVGFLGSLYACYWFLSRCFLGQACMADNGISASHYFNKAYNMAKSNQALLRPIAFTFMGIWLAIVVIGLLLIVINIELAQDYREGASIGVVMVSPLYCIVVSYQRLVLNLAYQRIRNQNAVTKVIGS